MGKLRPRYNEKARQSSKKPTQLPHPNPRGSNVAKSNEENLGSRVEITPEMIRTGINIKEFLSKDQKMSRAKQKRLEKFIEREVKKEERAKLMDELSKSSVISGLLKSSKSLGKSKETLKEAVKRAYQFEKAGIASEEQLDILYSKIGDSKTESEIISKQKLPKPEPKSTTSPSFGSALKKKPIFGGALKKKPIFGGALKRKAEQSGSEFSKKPLLISAEAESSSDEDDSLEENREPENAVMEVKKSSDTFNQPLDNSKEPQKDDIIDDNQVKVASVNLEPCPSFYVVVNRPEHVQEQRLKLPILAEESKIMEVISENDVTILCGSTGSGKTTQLPQFLYESGYADRGGPRPGKIGITQPRRVAAVSMANRVAKELSLGSNEVSYQIRYDGTVTKDTKIKFMTDGILLKEISSDLLLNDYSCIIIDEAHERSINTDILIGMLSRVVRLRRKMADSGKENMIAGKSVKIRPLKLIIMSATLRVEDFARNPRLFSIAPPVINVESRQYPVITHFNRRTPENYLEAAYKKVTKIHKRLPAGGILVFLTGQNEVVGLCRMLKKRFSEASSGKKCEKQLHTQNSIEDQSLGSIEESEMMERLDDSLNEDVENDDHDLSESDFSEEECAEVEKKDIEENEMPLHVLPLYAMLPTDKQLQVFQDPPEGARLCVVATNVAETSLTIPNIKYVVDCGKVKEKKYDPITGVTAFSTVWTSKASSDQRAGRAGRTGPGHAYRLFSSAVFNNYFDQFSLPEILRMSIEGVVLQMKKMRIDATSNFPFPLAPEKKQLEVAENLLVKLGALDIKKKRITTMGMQMAIFPVAPRFARMLVDSLKRSDCIGYAINLVAALSVDDPFIRFSGDLEDEETNEEEAKNKESFAKVYSKFSNGLGSDLLTLIRVMGAYDFSSDKEEFCKVHFLRAKTMKEIEKLRLQLKNFFMEIIPGVEISVSRLNPFNENQISFLRDLIIMSFIDKIAIIGEKEFRKQRNVPYHALDVNVTLCDLSEAKSTDNIFIHPSSSLAGSDPAAVVFQDLQLSSSNMRKSIQNNPRTYMKGVTEIHSLASLGFLCPSACRFGKPLEQPPPFYDENKDVIMAYTEPTIGTVRPINLPELSIPMQSLKIPESSLMRNIAKQIVDGNLFKTLGKYTKCLNSKTSLFIHPKIGINHGKVAPWIQSMMRRGFGGFSTFDRGIRSEILLIWAETKSFLLEPYLSWVDEQYHDEIRALWPPIDLTSHKN